MLRDWYGGVDVGTSGCRALAIDRSGRLVANARAPLAPSSRPRAGWSEQRPDDWWRAVSKVLGAIAEHREGQLRGLCIDATSSTLLLADRHGAALTAGLMYDDRRAEEAAGRVARVAPPESAARGPGSALSKLLHLVRDSPPEGASHALHQADWLSGMLTGRFGIADENNALKLGYDPVDRRWPEWLNALPEVTKLLPHVVPAGTPLGTIDPRVAVDLGLPSTLTIVAGTTDSTAATLATGAAEVGDAATSLGSTLALKVWSERPIFAARFGVYSHRVGDRWLVGGASNTGGAVLRQFFSDEALDRLSQAIDPDRPSGLDYYPLPAPGERFPTADPALAPRLTPVPEDRVRFLHGLLEGIARIEAEGYHRLADLGAPYPTRVYSAGGGAANPTWTRIRARLLGATMVPARQQEAAYGAAELARRALTVG